MEVRAHTVMPAKSDSDVVASKDIESINYLCIYPIRVIGLIYTRSTIRVGLSGVYKLMFNLTIINKLLHHCHFWLARQ